MEITESHCFALREFPGVNVWIASIGLQPVSRDFIALSARKFRDERSCYVSRTESWTPVLTDEQEANARMR